MAGMVGMAGMAGMAGMGAGVGTAAKGTNSASDSPWRETIAGLIETLPSSLLKVEATLYVRWSSLVVTPISPAAARASVRRARCATAPIYSTLTICGGEGQHLSTPTMWKRRAAFIFTCYLTKEGVESVRNIEQPLLGCIYSLQQELINRLLIECRDHNGAIVLPQVPVLPGHRFIAFTQKLGEPSSLCRGRRHVGWRAEEWRGW